MVHYLPDTALTTLSMGLDVYTYAQDVDGVLIECRGKLKIVRGKPDIYSFTLATPIFPRYEDDLVLTGAPKWFTPLAAAHIQSNRARGSDI